MFCKKCGSNLKNGVCKKCGSATALKSCANDLEQLLYTPRSSEKKYHVTWMVRQSVWEEQQLPPGSPIIPQRPTPTLVGKKARFLGWQNAPSVMPEHDLRIYARIGVKRNIKWYHSRWFLWASRCAVALVGVSAIWFLLVRFL